MVVSCALAFSVAASAESELKAPPSSLGATRAWTAIKKPPAKKAEPKPVVVIETAPTPVEAIPAPELPEAPRGLPLDDGTEMRALDASEILFAAEETLLKLAHSEFQLLNQRVEPGEFKNLRLGVGESFSGESLEVPVLIAHGQRPGPVLCLTAAVHGDELNGVEVVRRIMFSVKPKELAGTVIGVPIVNLQGFSRSSRYLPDRRDLNRFFPGTPGGSSASRIAYAVFNEVIRYCSALVDLHTGSFYRTNLPQIRGDLRIAEVLEFTRGFGATAVLQTSGPKGSLRRAATDIGIPAVTFEIGEPNRLEVEEVRHGVKAIETLMFNLGLLTRFRLWREPQPVFYGSKWVRTPSGGLLIASVELGEKVKKGQRLGTVTDPISNQRVELRSPVDGNVLGMALNQVVMPGFAAYHVGVAQSANEAAEQASSNPGGLEAPVGEADPEELDAER
jgi:uncharacterized protein